MRGVSGKVFEGSGRKKREENRINEMKRRCEDDSMRRL